LCRRYIHNQAHAIWLRCVRICHFYRKLSRITVFRRHSVYPNTKREDATAEIIIFRNNVTVSAFDLGIWRYHMEIWYSEGSTQRLPVRTNSTLYIRIPAWQKIPSQSWWFLYSKVCKQKIGVSQGSILSVTLFCLINSSVKALCRGIDCSLYVDDLSISSFVIVLNIERHLRRCLNKLQPNGRIPYWWHGLAVARWSWSTFVPRRARLILRWVTVCRRYVTSHLGWLSLPFFGLG